MVGVMTRLRAEQFRVRIPVGARDFFLLQNLRLAVGTKWLGHELNYSPPSSAKVKNDWRYTSTPPICLHGMDREKLYLFLPTLFIYEHAGW
jgi:hypothetical protein